MESNAPESDAVWREVDEVFGGKVGDAYDPGRLDEIFKEGRERYDNKIPPGCEDARNDRGAAAEGGEGNRRFGDLIPWKQTLDKAKETGLPIILVTDDRKEDGWWKSTGKTVGPRPKLVEEMRAWAGVEFYITIGTSFRDAQARFRDAITGRKDSVLLTRVRGDPRCDSRRGYYSCKATDHLHPCGGVDVPPW